MGDGSSRAAVNSLKIFACRAGVARRAGVIRLGNAVGPAQDLALLGLELLELRLLRGRERTEQTTLDQLAQPAT